tara:strand:+ start:418 stop:1200 length:783 start_codon:yes stop_codon:yes gene_type:complete
MVNIEELRKKYQEINNPGGSGGNNDFLSKFFMMDEGTSVVRVLPAKSDDKEFYAETAIHRINDKNYHCPRVKEQKCPVCDEYYALWKEINAIGKDTPEGRQLADLARQIKARKRYYMNVVDRRDNSVKILSVGQKLFGKVLDCFFDEDFGDITDLKEGWDFKIVKDTQGQWPNYDKSSPKPKQSPAGSDAENAQFMDEVHDIHGLVKIAAYDELKNLMLEMNAARGNHSAPVASASTEATQAPTEDADDYMSHLKDLKVD